jgi:diguanylate cyclase (GGDEF)-like protein
VHAKAMREIILPTVRGMAADGIPFTGFLYAGLMIGKDGSVKTLEFNCRMGDPETQPIMMRLKSDFLDLLEHGVAGTLDQVEAEWDRRVALGVVLAAANYPDTPRKGDVISGLPNGNSFATMHHVFHAGTAEQGRPGRHRRRSRAVRHRPRREREARAEARLQGRRRTSASTACSSAPTSATARQHRLYALTSDVRMAVTPLPPPDNDPVIDAALKGQRGISTIRNAANAEELVAITEIPRANWLLIARQPTVDAFEPVSNTLRNALLITALLAIPSIILLLAILNRLLQPMAELAAQLHKMADGSRPMRPVETRSADEVADVAHSFNRLQSRLLEQEQRLAQMAHQDTLTGLPNRRMIELQMESELRRIQRNGLGLALLFLDIDGFKPVNDAYGHQVGDLVLVAIAQRLREAVRDVDTVARLGGDEFLILLNDTELPLEAAERVAQESIRVLAEPILIDDLNIRIGVSIGIASCYGAEAEVMTVHRLVSQADNAMYQAKADGRNRYVAHDGDLPPPLLQ